VPNDLFWRVPKFDPFDVFELSLTGYLWGLQQGREWVALPVFPGWTFGCHTETLVNVRSGIDRPEDLRGKRVGVPEYPVTAIMWIRHAWQTENGVRPADIQWFEERTDEFSHYRLMGYRPPEGVSVQVIPDAKFLCDMLIAGEIDAVTRYFGRRREHAEPILVDRSYMGMQELAQHPNVRWLYPDRKAAAIDYHQRIGHLQPIHCIVMKTALVREHPWVPLNLVNAFDEACRLTAGGDYVKSFSYELSKDEQRRVIGDDFWPVGLRRNRTAVEAFLRVAFEDGYRATDRPLSIEEFFEESTVST